MDRALTIRLPVVVKTLRPDHGCPAAWARRLLIVPALVHRPRLVLGDEPSVGLDPHVRQARRRGQGIGPNALLRPC